MRGVLFLMILATAGAASAEPSPYCRRTQARAEGDAALLIAPHVFVQGIRFPATQATDVGVTVGRDMDLRAGVSFSPIDFVRGLRVLRVGEADCALHDRQIDIEQVLDDGTDAARLAALHEKMKYLDAHRDEWRALLAKAEERLASQAITLVELDVVRRNVAALEIMHARAGGEISQLEARAPRKPQALPHPLSAAYQRDALAFERQVSRLRKLDPWQVRLVGGVVLLGERSWYGVVEVSLDLGIVGHARSESRYLAARTEELRARYQPAAKLERLQKVTRAAVEQNSRQLEVVERELAFLARTEQLLAGSDGPNILQARDAIVIERIDREAEAAFLRALAAALAPYMEHDND
jgi:hypothetical protein